MTARGLAVRALVRQEQSGYSNLVWDAALKACRPPLDTRDAAFAARIFYTTLERQNLLDHCLNRFSRRPVDKLDAPVRAILRAGLAQAKFMQVPLPAAVNEAVKLTKVMGKSSASGMVNAVLRRAAALEVGPQDFPDPLERLTVYYSLSRPVAELLHSQYGAEADALAAALLRDPDAPTAIRVNPLITTDAALTKALTDAGHSVQPGPWPHSLLVRFRGSPAETKPFRSGCYHVQGLASQLAAMSLDASPGDRVWDACAAPGGKSLTLAQQMQNRGELLSGESVAARVRLIDQAFARCGITCGKAVCADAAVPNQRVFDKILCDVPCSGLGVIAKKPDIRYKSLEGMPELLRTQQAILQNAARSLAPGGRLVYSTCTVNRQENEQQIETFLSHNPDFHTVPSKITIQGGRDTPFGTLLLPQNTATDGFFVCILEKSRV